MLWTLIWLAGIFLGYAIFMSQTPLRSYFSDALALIRERGSAHLWVIAGLLSFAGAGIDLWRHYEGGGSFAWGASVETPRLHEVAVEIPARGGRMLGDLFSTIVAGGSVEIGGGARGMLVGALASLLIVSAALILQYYTLLFLYVRISGPARRIKPGKLLELALRRVGRTWPLLLICWLVWAMPLIGGVAGASLAFWWIGAATLFVVFAFLEVGVLSGERDLKGGIQFNFECWKKGGAASVWFLVIAFVNLCSLALVEVIGERSIAAGSVPGIVVKMAFVFARSFVLVWLLGAWLLMFCDRFVGPKTPRPK